jgi:flavodoxin
MKIVVAFDSYFGNTQKIAEAVAGGFAPHHSVEVVRVSECKPEQLQGVELLVVGSPTRAFSASEATKAFLKGLPGGALRGVKVAAFDTRMDVTKAPGILRFLAGIFGFAAAPIAARLKQKGGTLAGEPAGFMVKDTEGPLEDGELDRAAAWAKTLV